MTHSGSINGHAQCELPSSLLHDLRTPLGHILGYSELLIEQMRDGKHEEFIPYLEKIRKAGHEMLGIMDENFTSGAPGSSR